MKYRPIELDQHRQIWLTKKAYNILRDQKRTQKKSMARINDNIIIEKYGL